MGRLMIVNGSPRAPQSNSKQYAALFRSFWRGEAYEYNVTQHSHAEAFARLENAEHLLLVFHLYADGIPAVLLDFLKAIEASPLRSRPTVHVLINCGFLEPRQNGVAIDMVRLFCRQNGFPFGSSLSVGSGEAILKTPFRFLVRRGARKLARAMQASRNRDVCVTMPLPAQTYVKASEKYWLAYGEKYGTTREQMDSMEIEKD